MKSTAVKYPFVVGAHCQYLSQKIENMNYSRCMFVAETDEYAQSVLVSRSFFLYAGERLAIMFYSHLFETTKITVKLLKTI